MSNIVIYHRSDFDGIFCREIAKRHFGPGTTYIGWEYNDPVPEVKVTDTLYILDLSVEGLMHHPNLVWIDHHKSAMEKYPINTVGYRIDGVAACRLAWQWFEHLQQGLDPHNNQLDPNLPDKSEYIARSVSEPWAVRLAGEYDIWDRRDPDAELFQHGLRSRDPDRIWPILLKDSERGRERVSELLEAGRGIQYAKTQENDSIIKAFGFTVKFEGLTFLVCNHARFNSHLFLAGLTSEHDACFGFNWTGKQWRVSLYHAPGKEHHDLSRIAVKYGGGGHRGACGFVTNNLPFLNV